MNYITKTIYLQFLSCGKNTWLQIYKPELKDLFKLSEFEQALLANGNLVEQWARKLFPNGMLVEANGEEAVKITQKHIDNKTPVIFQATFAYKEFMARNDVLEYDKTNDCWNLYEIKGNNKLNQHEDKVDHIEDATFQVIVLESCGIKIGRISIIHLNKKYVRDGEINIQDLFEQSDITDEVTKRKERTKGDMERASKALLQPNEQALVCQCIYNGRSAHCTTFRHSYPNIPEYSVHDLIRIGKSPIKLESLVDSQIFDINEILDDFELSIPQSNQALVYKRQNQIINIDDIREELKSLDFPLYFFDYETYPSAIPLFDGYKPYQHIPFQFSLHVLNDPDGELTHYEYLHEEQTDPSLSIISELQKTIGPKGAIIVWRKSFEKGRNSDLAKLHPDYADFLNDLNSRIYDLEDVFTKQLHVDYRFKGKTSIKKVLPVLVPSLSYDKLEIKEGGAAMEAWYEMMYGDGSAADKKKISYDLKVYCGQDTFAMYSIWKVLWDLL